MRTCKVPPTRQHAVCRGLAPSPITHYGQALLLVSRLSRLSSSPPTFVGRRASRTPGPACHQVGSSPRPQSCMSTSQPLPLRRDLHPLHSPQPRLTRRPGLPLSPTFTRTSDRTSGFDSTYANCYAEEPPSNWASTSRCNPALRAESHRLTSSDGEVRRAGSDPATLRRLVRPSYRGLSLSEGPVRTPREPRPETELRPSQLELS